MTSALSGATRVILSLLLIPFFLAVMAITPAPAGDIERVETHMAELNSEYSGLMTRHTMCQKLEAYSRRNAMLAEAIDDFETAKKWSSRAQHLESKMREYRDKMNSLADRHLRAEEIRNNLYLLKGSQFTPSPAPGFAPTPGTGIVVTPPPPRGGYPAPTGGTVTVTPRPPGGGSGRPPGGTTVAPSKPPVSGIKSGTGSGLLNVYTPPVKNPLPPVKSPQKPPIK